MFDTHCHLNFKTFLGKEKEVFDKAKKNGVKLIVIPSTDLETSKIAVEQAKKFPQVYAAIGIHPHHVYEIQNLDKKKINDYLHHLINLINQPKVIAIGEVGLDHYIYQKTKYKDYQISKNFIELQKIFFIKQIKIAVKYKKTLIIHNRLAKNDLLPIIKSNQSLINKINLVFHCCEPDEDLLTYAIKNNIYIGVDGDITYNEKKQKFVKKIPLNLLVLETDSPFLLPEPLRQQKFYPNEPKNLSLITKFIANLIKLPVEKLVEQTTKNGKKLFNI